MKITRNDIYKLVSESVTRILEDIETTQTMEAPADFDVEKFRLPNGMLCVGSNAMPTQRPTSALCLYKRTASINYLKDAQDGYYMNERAQCFKCEGGKWSGARWKPSICDFEILFPIKFMDMVRIYNHGLRKLEPITEEDVRKKVALSGTLQNLRGTFDSMQPDETRRFGFDN